MSAQATRPPGEVKPNPDPSTLTTDRLLREIGNLEDKIDVRLEGMDRAIILLQKIIDTFPQLRAEGLAQLHGLLNEKFDGLEKLYDEKFGSISTQFAERDTRTEQTARDGKVAIDAALQAQKEAVGKSEVGFTKQIDAIGVLINQFAKSADEKIDDLKTRVTAGEGLKKGASDNWGVIIGIGGFLVALISVGILIANNVGGG